MPGAGGLGVQLPWPFDREYMQLALMAGCVVGACAPLIGAFLVQRRMSLLGDGIGHLAFAGVAGGLLIGVWPVWAALAVAVAGALGIEHLRARGRTSGDLALALFFYSGIAAGVVLVGLSDSFNAGLLSYLFGGILTVEPGEVWVVVALGAVIVATVLVCGRALFAIVLDEEAARVSGLPVNALNALLAVLAAATVVASMRVVGILLVAAMMVLPVATAQLLTRSFKATLRVSVAIGVGAVVVGLGAARAWALAPGGTIVLTTAAAFAVASLLLGRRRGGGPLGAGLA
ncbi:MAG: metal ABC transporter permease, partial [Actinomycetota bacterium]|nr:metal ABC transporter permease [Actinomycetota bacterium]